ncbi:MAG TPA: hypothetical protein PLR83_06215 [Pyrinomonadaceae bacterium]|nr:hypothetical protein [Pyrinomonadaceae bacterium]
MRHASIKLNASKDADSSRVNYFNYYTEIEDTFVRRRGKHLFLSPLDWAMIEAWKGRGIPLHIVVRSIEAVFDVFDRQPAGTRTIKSLFYCREEIEIQYKEWQTSQTGKGREQAADANGEFTVERVREHIDECAEQLTACAMASLSEGIARAVTHLSEIKANLTDDFDTVDKTLSDVERLLDRTLIENWEPNHLAGLEASVKTQLKPYKSEMEPEKYRQTYELMLMKKLREEAGVPRLGLYFL